MRAAILTVISSSSDGLTLKNLKNSKDIIIKQADKSFAVVALDLEDYKMEAYPLAHRKGISFHGFLDACG